MVLPSALHLTSVTALRNFITAICLHSLLNPVDYQLLEQKLLGQHLEDTGRQATRVPVLTARFTGRRQGLIPQGQAVRA